MTITDYCGVTATIATSIVSLLAMGSVSAQIRSVSAIVETDPIPTPGGDADDIAMWVHPTVPGSSTVIGTDKRNGIGVYDLAGNQLQYLADGWLNNVDLRYNFPLTTAGVAIVTSGEVSQTRLAIYTVNPNTGTLRDVAARNINLGFPVLGCCMYQSQVTGDYYFIGTSGNGQVEQWQLIPDQITGLVDAVRVRSFTLGSRIEGCVADDENGWLYIAEETVGIWRYGAEPGAGTTRVLVDTTGPSGRLTADVEGLSIYYAAGGLGYLLASSQGNSTFVIYDRNPPHGHVRTFQIVDNPALGIDGVTDADGIDVVNLGLGTAFPSGLFVAHDDDNPGAEQNYKYVSWADIASAANPPLLVDTTYDALGARCGTAGWAYRNGSGTNPSILTNVQPPVLGGTWASDLDCTGTPPGLGAIYLFDQPGSGQYIGGNEILIDPASFLLLGLWAPHTGHSVSFQLPLPLSPVLCNVPLYVQGACFGPPSLVLSNAIDLKLGL